MCMYPFGSCLSADICPGVGLQGHLVALFLVFLGTSILFSIVAVPIYIPTNNVGGKIHFSSHPLQHLLSVDFQYWPFWLVSYFIAALFCISLIISDVEHLFKHQLLLYWLCQSLWLCGSQSTVENSERDGNTRPPDLPLVKSVCRSGSNS